MAQPGISELHGLDNLPATISASLHEIASITIEPLHAKHPDYRAFSRHLLSRTPRQLSADWQSKYLPLP